MSEEETRDVPAVQQAMKVLSQYINATERENDRLTKAETRLTEQNRGLTERVRVAERISYEKGEEERRLTGAVKDIERQLAELVTATEQKIDGLTRRAEEAERVAADYNAQNETLKQRAELGERLGSAAEKMVAAIDRLPHSMKTATIVRSTAQEIALYDTVEWQAVSDARFLLLRALGEPSEEMGG